VEFVFLLDKYTPNIVVVETEIRSEAATLPAEPKRGDRWVENRPASRWGTFDLREIWAYRELGVAFAMRSIKLRYKQTVFGVAWAVLQPLLAVVIFTIFFGRLGGLPADGIAYPLFAYVGMTVWLYFSSSVSSAAQSLVENRDLISKVYFPRVLAPASAVLAGIVDLAIALVISAAFMVGYHVVPSVALVLLPLWIVLAVALALAVGLWLSALNVKYRDVKYVLGFMMTIWLFASPVIYSASLVEGDWKYLFALNPVVGLLAGFRWSLIDAPAPDLSAIISLGVGVVLLVSGAVYFRKVESFFADLI
jgi:lipopolysaccharide transport system permease protein